MAWSIHLSLHEAMTIYSKTTICKHQSFLQGAGNRRGTQLPKCVHSHCLTASEYITQTCSKEGSPLHCVCVSCMHHVCLLRYISLQLLFLARCWMPNMFCASPMCVSIDPQVSLSVLLQWSVSHGDLIAWPPNDTHFMHPCRAMWLFPKITYKVSTYLQNIHIQLCRIRLWVWHP